MLAAGEEAAAFIATNLLQAAPNDAGRLGERVGGVGWAGRARGPEHAPHTPSNTRHAVRARPLAHTHGKHTPTHTLPPTLTLPLPCTPPAEVQIQAQHTGALVEPIVPGMKLPKVKSSEPPPQP